MKTILTAVLFLVITPYLSEANWCLEEITVKLKVTKAQTKVITFSTWFGGSSTKTVSEVITVEVPKTSHRRVCCAGFTFNMVRRICEPNCSEGCPQFSECVNEIICKCQSGYQMKRNRCEPICETACGDNSFCSKPDVCLCKSGFEYDNVTESCVEDRINLDHLSTQKIYAESEAPSTESSTESKLRDVTSIREVNMESTENSQTHSTKSESQPTSIETIRKSSAATDSEVITEVQEVPLGSVTSSETPTSDKINFTESSTASELEDLTKTRVVHSKSTENPQTHSTKSEPPSTETTRKSSTPIASEVMTEVHWGSTTSSEQLTIDKLSLSTASKLKDLTTARVVLSKSTDHQQKHSTKSKSSSTETTRKLSTASASEVIKEVQEVPLGSETSSGTPTAGEINFTESSTASELEDLTKTRVIHSKSTENPLIHSTKSESPLTVSSTASASKDITEVQHWRSTTSSGTLSANEISFTESFVLPLCSFSCIDGVCQFSSENCQCDEGFVKADSSCHLDYEQGFKSGECIQKSFCKELTTDNKTPTTTEQVLSSVSEELLTFTLADHSTNCDYECSGGGICANGVCQCPKGSVFSLLSKGCIIISCDKSCHNGICQENGVCECLEGFIYQLGNGCIPNCHQDCINGICIAPGICECYDGFGHEPDNFIECLPHSMLSGKHERRDKKDFPWIWIVLTVLSLATLGLLFMIKTYRKHDYNVEKFEKLRLASYLNNL